MRKIYAMYWRYSRSSLPINAYSRLSAIYEANSALSCIHTLGPKTLSSTSKLERKTVAKGATICEEPIKWKPSQNFQNFPCEDLSLHDLQERVYIDHKERDPHQLFIRLDSLGPNKKCFYRFESKNDWIIIY